MRLRGACVRSGDRSDCPPVVSFLHQVFLEHFLNSPRPFYRLGNNTGTQTGKPPGLFSAFDRIELRPVPREDNITKLKAVLLNMKNRLTGRLGLKSRKAAIVALSLMAVTSLSQAEPSGQVSNRVVAWGDMKYDLPVSGDMRASGRSALAQVAAGDFHSLVLKGDGAVVAWGDNAFGQTSVPFLVNKKSAAEIAAGNIHSLALMSDGTVASWGPAPGQYGDYGQCSVPFGLKGVVAVAAGAVHSLALRGDGTVVAWGANLNGQCSVPAGLSDVVAVAGGMYHSLALRSDGSVVAWGDSRHGQTSIPAGLSNVVAIAAGGFHNLALLSNGTVVSWGTYGLAQCDVPEDLTNVIAIATGDYHSLALKKDGTVLAWGFNTAGQCDVPPGLTHVIGVSARGNHSMVLVQEVQSPVRVTRPAPKKAPALSPY